MTEKFSAVIAAPNAGGVQSHTLKQVIDGKTVAATATLTVDFCALVSTATPVEGSQVKTTNGQVAFSGTGTTGDVIVIKRGGKVIASGAVDAAGNWEAIGYGNPDYTYNVECNYTHAGVTATTPYTFTSVSTTK